MKEFDSVDDILEFAIKREQEAADFYASAAAKVEKDWIKQIFTQYSREERGHEAKLKAVRKGQKMLSSQEKVADLKMGDYLADVEMGPDLTYQEILVVAMKREKAAFKLYNDLAEKVDEPEIKELFFGLAQEEAKHKLRFEIEYDERILRDN